jgi:hypothetical protein
LLMVRHIDSESYFGDAARMLSSNNAISPKM